MERLFSRHSKLGKHNECPNLQNKTERSDRHDTVDLLQSGTVEYRLCAWQYLLQQRQRRQQQQKHRIKNCSENNDLDAKIQELFSKLFDAEYCHCEWQQHATTIPYCDEIDNADSSYPLESILERVNTDQDRKIAFQAVLLIQDYFTLRYQGTKREHNSMNNATNQAKMKICRRLIPLFVRLAVASSNRRTLLAQTAWETAILLLAFCIRSTFSASSSSSTSQPFFNLPPNFWGQLDLLLQQQLTWQQSKKKLNAAKINQLQEAKTKVETIVDNDDNHQESFNQPRDLFLECCSDLEKLLQSEVL